MMKNKEQKILQDWIDTLQGVAVKGMDIKTKLEARLLRNAWIAENKKIENEIRYINISVNIIVKNNVFDSIVFSIKKIACKNNLIRFSVRVVCFFVSVVRKT